MLNDYWVIAQLLAQACTLALLLYGAGVAASLIAHWNPASGSERQIDLERKSYLVGSINSFALFFQVLLLLMFINTVNQHLNQQIEGAMCATGVLGVNDYGYPLLYLKLGSLLIYGGYVALNRLDNREPAYPLTPHKFYLIFPALAFMLTDLYWTYQFFAKIEPNIIATCCSVSFGAENPSPYDLFASAQYLELALGLFGFSFLLLVLSLGLWGSRYRSMGLLWIQLGLSLLYVISAIYTLKYFFVKYVYGLPSHQCLFDIFWFKYYGLGYVFFASYYALVYVVSIAILLQLFQKLLSPLPAQAWRRLAFWGQLALLLSFGIPVLYWYFWTGNL